MDFTNKLAFIFGEPHLVSFEVYREYRERNQGMKAWCVVCENPVEDSEIRWQRDGNFCRRCCEKANKGVRQLQAKEAAWIKLKQEIKGDNFEDYDPDNAIVAI